MRKLFFVRFILPLTILLLGLGIYHGHLLPGPSLPASPSFSEWPLTLPLWTPTRGEEWTYDLSYRGQAQWPGLPEDGLAFGLEGKLSILILSEDHDDLKVWMRIQPDAENGWNLVPQNVQDALRASWFSGVGAWMSARGFFLKPELAGLDPAVQQFWKSLAERLQVRLPAELSSFRWQNEEEHGDIPLLVDYALDPKIFLESHSGKGFHVTRSFAQAGNSERLIQGKTQAVFAPRFAGILVLEAETHEEQQFQGQMWSSESRLSLRWKETATLDEAALATVEHVRDMRQLQKSATAEEASIHRQALGSMDFDTLWDKLRTGTEANADDLYLKLKAWVYLHPHRLDILLERIKGRDAADPLMKTAIRALAGSGRSEGQNALVVLLQQHDSDEQLGLKIISTLAFVPEPTQKAQEAVEALSRGPVDNPLRSSSHLVLGAMGRQLAASPEPASRERAKTIEKVILDSLRSASGRRAILDALAVVGNFGINRLDDLQPWLNDPDPEIRANAYFALRFGKPENTPEFLAKAFSLESDVHVRRQMLQALALRPANAHWFQATQSLVAGPLTDAEKVALARSLVSNVRQHGETSMRLLQALLDQTQDQALRENLARFQEAARNQLSL